MMELEDDVASVGTHVDMEASVRSAMVADVDLLQQARELTFEDFEYLTTSDVNKLDGQDWKKQKHLASPKKFERKSSFEDTSLSTILDLKDALKRFGLDKEGRLNEVEKANLFQT